MNQATVLLTIFFLTALLAGCGSKKKEAVQDVTKSGDQADSSKAMTNEPLTEAFFPLNPAQERKMVWRNYKIGASTKKVTFEEFEGTMTWVRDRNIQQVFNLDPNTMTMKFYPGGTGGEFRKVDGGIDQLVCKKPEEWLRLFMFKSKPGEHFVAHTPATNTEYRVKYTECIQNRGIPCAVVVCNEMYGNHHVAKRRFFLMKGVGIVKSESYGPIDKYPGQWFPLDQAFYSEWEGDRNPLEIEYIKK